jgi:hypothetical protein
MACAPTTSVRRDFEFEFAVSTSWFVDRNFFCRRMNDIPGFRQIFRDDGTVSHEELFTKYVKSPTQLHDHRMSSNVPIDPSKAPITVNPKQFEAINFRRAVRYEIEKSRSVAGRPINGRRAHSYKYLTKHLVANGRLRNPDGSFSLVKTDDQHIYSINDV